MKSNQPPMPFGWYRPHPAQDESDGDTSLPHELQKIWGLIEKRKYHGFMN
jgi:hypothetical protein